MKNKFSLLSLAVLLGAFWSAHFASALTVSPTFVDYTLSPGMSTSSVMKISNDTNASSNFTISLDRFTARGEEGEQDFVGDVPNGITNWIKLPFTSFNLKPGETKEVNFTL